MKTQAALAASALLACACATQGAVIEEAPVADDPASAVEKHYPSIHDMGTEFDPGASVGVLHSQSLLEPMPFGWSTPPNRPIRVARSSEPDPNEPITVDFVGTDLHTFLHYIALHAGLQIIVQGNLELVMPDKPVFPEGVDKKEYARKLIQSIARPNKLDIIEDSNVIVLKQRVSDEVSPSVTKSDIAGRFDIDFVDCELIAALMETARVTGRQVFIPAQRLEHIPEVRITLLLVGVAPEQVFRELAHFGNLEIEEVKLEEDEFVGYRFTYKE